MTGRGAGFSLVEVMVATLVMSGLLVAAMTTVGAVTTGRIVAQQQAMGHQLAAELMTEILEQRYAEGETLGRDAGESGAGDRTRLDDVDDYAGLTDAPPTRRDGEAIPGAGEYSREVEVVWVARGSLSSQASAESGVKRITVTVRLNGRPVAELVALRSRAYPHAEARLELPR